MISILAGSTPFILNTCKDNNVPETKQLAVNSSQELDVQQENENIIIEKTNEETSFVEDTVVIEAMDSEYISEVEFIEKGPKNYHIVVGSFEKEIYALSYMKNLTKKNDLTQIIEYNGLYRVSFYSYSDSDEAEIELDYIRNTLNLRSWIAYMK